MDPVAAPVPRRSIPQTIGRTNDPVTTAAGNRGDAAANECLKRNCSIPWMDRVGRRVVLEISSTILNWPGAIVAACLTFLAMERDCRGDGNY